MKRARAISRHAAASALVASAAALPTVQPHCPARSRSRGGPGAFSDIRASRVEDTLSAPRGPGVEERAAQDETPEPRRMMIARWYAGLRGPAKSIAGVQRGQTCGCASASGGWTGDSQTDALQHWAAGGSPAPNTAAVIAHAAQSFAGVAMPGEGEGARGPLASGAPLSARVSQTLSLPDQLPPAGTGNPRRAGSSGIFTSAFGPIGSMFQHGLISSKAGRARQDSTQFYSE